MIKVKITEMELDGLSQKWLNSSRTSIFQFLAKECFEVEKSALEQADDLIDEMLKCFPDGRYNLLKDEIKRLYHQAIAEAKEQNNGKNKDK